MNDDIVTRLRNEVCECGYAASFNELHKCLWCEAADDIEDLRAEINAWRKVAVLEHASWSQCKDGCDCLEKAMRNV